MKENKNVRPERLSLSARRAAEPLSSILFFVTPAPASCRLLLGSFRAQSFNRIKSRGAPGGPETTDNSHQ